MIHCALFIIGLSLKFQHSWTLQCNKKFIDEPQISSLDLNKDTFTKLEGCEPIAFKFEQTHQKHKRIRIHITREDILTQVEMTKNTTGCNSNLDHCSCILVSAQKIPDKHNNEEINFHEKDVVYHSVWQTMIGRAVIDIDIASKSNMFKRGFILVLLKKPKTFCQSKDFDISIDGEEDMNRAKNKLQSPYEMNSIPINIELIELEGSWMTETIIVIAVYSILSVAMIILSKLIKTGITGMVIVPENYEPFSLLLKCVLFQRKANNSSDIKQDDVIQMGIPQNISDLIETERSISNLDSINRQLYSSAKTEPLDLNAEDHKNVKGFYIDLLDESDEESTEEMNGVDSQNSSTTAMPQSSIFRSIHFNATDIKKALGIDASQSIAVITTPTKSFLRKHRRQNGSILQYTSSSYLQPTISKSLYLKNEMYFWTIVLSGLFYTIPAIQLMIGAQSIARQTGSLDTCYYNFLCRQSTDHFQDYGHVFSNICYIFNGLLLIVLVYIRRQRRRNAMIKYYYENKSPTKIFDAKRWKRLKAKYAGKSVEHLNQRGIPEQYGIFFGLGMALIFQGILSGCYHVCPVDESFQFDTTFMYVTCVLVLTKIYQLRHPDITINSNNVFLIVVVLLLFEAVGYYVKHHVNVAFYIFIFILTYLFTVLALILCFLYQKTFWEIIEDSFNFCKGDQCKVHQRADAVNRLKSESQSRLIFTLTMIGLNLLLAGFITYKMLTKRQVIISDYLTVIFGTNMVGYAIYYISMKAYYVARFKRTNECISMTCWMYIILCLLALIPASIYFADFKYKTTLSPSESRHLNDECTLGIFDSHDIWHFFSSLGLLFACMALLTIEDNNTLTPWNEIPVF